MQNMNIKLVKTCVKKHKLNTLNLKKRSKIKQTFSLHSVSLKH